MLAFEAGPSAFEAFLCCKTNLYYRSILDVRKFEPHHEKTYFMYVAKTKAQISCMVTTQLISVIVLATYIVQFFYFLNPKFQASSHYQKLYSPNCVDPGQKSQRQVFS